MKLLFSKYQRKVQAIAVCCFAFLALSASAVNIPNQPLSIQQAATPMIMLAFGRDHRLYYEAYNDASDIDGDGAIDIRFKPYIEYLGLFDSKLCYSHNNSSANTGVFSPSAFATTISFVIPAPTTANPSATRSLPATRCSSGWSGNWLNYVTTSRIDALRVVLYGGMRSVDTATQTILQRAYIPQDAHSWAKEYTSLAVDGYRISDYTPLSQPTANRRHFFGNLTPNATTNCNPLSNCSGLAPWLSVVENSDRRVWEWASTERPVLAATTANPVIMSGTTVRNAIGVGAIRTDRTVRVRACVSGFITSNETCKLYPNGNYKPVGVLHTYGETDQSFFGLFTGSYDSNMSGGRLRKVMSSFRNEFSASDGTFDNTVQGIVHNFNQFRLYAFNRGRTDQIYAGDVVGGRAMRQGEFPDWGNPIGELMYEATRYLANKGAPTAAYINDSANTAINTVDDLIGLSRPAWDYPYAQTAPNSTTTFTSAANAPVCARANILTISDTNVSFDSDQLPRVNTNFSTATFSTDLTGRHVFSGVSSSLDVSLVADFITANEPGIANTNRFIGQSGNVNDSAPTAKAINSLSSIRGLAPEEPTKQGSYYSASVAHYAKVNDLNANLSGNQTVDNFIVALASPLLRIQAPLPNGKVISILPIAKSVGGAFGITPGKTAFQPTNQIVDFYVESVVNSGSADYDPSINGGLYEAKFRINFEDVEQGNDHDMDAIVSYTVRAKTNNTLDVIVEPLYEAGGVNHRMGYIISGSNRDGTYLTVQDNSDQVPYFLNVPPGRQPGYCDVTGTPPADCNRLPYTYGTAGTATISSLASTRTISIFNFQASAAPTTATANYLRDPLWYAAKWGGFSEDPVTGNGIPDAVSKWDNANNQTGASGISDGEPDNYLLVQNPTSLRQSLKRAIEGIIVRNGSSSNLQSNSSGRLDTNTLIYRGSYTSGSWIGEIEALPITLNGIGTTPIWKASEKIPTWNSRQLFINGSDNSLINISNTTFSALPITDSLSISSENIYSYIKGDKSREVANGGVYRNRSTLLGDIIHSSPSYDLDSNTLYMGSNGGFLHAFNGLTGVEKFGLMPQEVVPRAKNLASVGYATSHEYFVDGATTLGIKVPQSNNNYYLYTLLGRGGKGLFSIYPGADGGTPSLLWEYTPRASAAAAADPDLGFMLGRPAPVLLNNGKLGLMVGNGYNSVSGKAVVYIFMLNTDGSLFGVKKLDSGVAGDNGMAGPAATDFDANGRADFVFAGDLKGNLWKFDIRDTDPDNWKLAYPSNQPMFKATDANGNPQPITAPITPVYNNISGGVGAEKFFLFFGTGSYFQSGDASTTSTQSWYGIFDDDTGINDGTPVPSVTTGSVTTSRNALKKRDMSNELNGTVGRVRYGSGQETDDMLGKRGWFYDFSNPINGERIVEANEFLVDTITPSLQAVSFFPTGGLCEPGGVSYENLVNPFSGANLKQPVLQTIQPRAPLGPMVDNPSPLSAGAENTKLWPTSRRLNVGIATSPINIGTSGSGSQDSPWLQLGGIVYGSPSINTTRSDYKRYIRSVASATPKPFKDCAGNLVTVISGSEGIEGTGLAGCSDARLRGRISWREILKD
jgi:type IV pilus assembly protein PilY1